MPVPDKNLPEKQRVENDDVEEDLLSLIDSMLKHNVFMIMIKSKSNDIDIR